MVRVQQETCGHLCIRVNPRYFEELALSAEEFCGQTCGSCEPDACCCSTADPRVPRLLLPRSTGDFGSGAEVLHSSAPRRFSPSERERNVLLEAEEPPYFLLLQLASFCWPTLHLAQASVPGLKAQPSLVSSCFCVCLLISALLLLLLSSLLSKAPSAAFFPQGSDVPFLQRLPWPLVSVWCRACGGTEPSPTRSPFPGADLQAAFVPVAALSDADCGSLVAAACSPLCIVRPEHADGIQ